MTGSPKPATSRPYELIRVRPCTPSIGAEVSAVDITRALPPVIIEELQRALAEHLVLFFRDQPLDFDSHKRFARYFGPLMIRSGVTGLPEHPEIVAVHADERSNHVAGESWESELTCYLEPPLGSILYLHSVPPTGGDTLFASMYAAYEALSPRMQVYLEGLTAVHDGERVFRAMAHDPSQAHLRSDHPIVRTHPVTGRKALFVNAAYTVQINGIPKPESDAVLAFLHQHCANPSFQVRLRWQPHSVAFWDNRCTQQLAAWDYYPQTRSGYCVTVQGERPV
jgi:taurine dioxygenase